jgi:hypothetical protein
VGRGVAAGAKRLADRLGASAAHSAIAVMDRAPVSTAAAEGQDGDQRVTAATLGAWIGDGRQVGQQVTGSATCSGTASASWVRADGIGDDSSAGTSVHGGHKGVVAA